LLALPIKVIALIFGGLAHRQEKRS